MIREAGEQIVGDPNIISSSSMEFDFPIIDRTLFLVIWGNYVEPRTGDSDGPVELICCTCMIVGLDACSRHPRALE